MSTLGRVGTGMVLWTLALVCTCPQGRQASASDTLPPPANVAATWGAIPGGVEVTWDRVAGADGYKVFRNTTTDAATAKSVGVAIVPPYLDTTAAAGTAYWYWVQTCSGAGASGLSAAAVGENTCEGVVWTSETVNWRVNYKNSWNKSGTVTKPGTIIQMRLHFSSMYIEHGFDHLTTSTGDNFSNGTQTDVLSTATGTGGVINLTLTSDGSVTGYFIIDRVDFWGVSAGAATATGPLFEQAAVTASVKGDLNGDKKSDIIFQTSTDNSLSVWCMNGAGLATAYLPVTYRGNPFNWYDWRLAGTADFDGDGQQDLLFQSSGGYVVIAFLTGLGINEWWYVYDSSGNTIHLGANWQVVGCGDFNDDGFPEVLLQNVATGDLSIWVLNPSPGNPAQYRYSLGVVDGSGTAVGLGANSGGWSVAGCGNFTGDAHYDILLHARTAGILSVWTMNRNVYQGGQWIVDSSGKPMNLGNNSGGWTVGALADYTGDGKTDIVWQKYSTGDLSIWRMNGATYTGSQQIFGGLGEVRYVPAGYAINALGDLNGDGRAELLLQNTAGGQVTQWTMNGNTFTGGSWITYHGSPVNLGTNSGGWAPGGIGDFNGDGKRDILWYNHAQGCLNVWMLNGGGAITDTPWITSGGSPISMGANSDWYVGGVGDFNGDGRPEILWHNRPMGTVTLWTLNGTAYTGSRWITDSQGTPMNLGTNSSGWTVAGVGDLNGDGKPEILWQNVALGLFSVWRVNGTVYSGGGFIADRNGTAINLGANSGGWRCCGCGELNRDGRAEIVLQNDGLQQVTIWTVNGTSYVSGAYMVDGVGTARNLGGDSGWTMSAPK